MTSDRQPKTALVVDDELFARLFAVQILLDQGYHVLEAEDAAAGLDAISRHQGISLLFTDISMPGGMDGIGLAEKARQVRPDLALVLTSGRTQPSDEEVPQGGKFLPKPYTARGLTRMIRELEAPEDGPAGDQSIQS